MGTKNDFLRNILLSSQLSYYDATILYLNVVQLNTTYHVYSRTSVYGLEGVCYTEMFVY